MARLKKPFIQSKQIESEQNTFNVLDQLKVKTKDFEETQIKEDDRADNVSLHISKIEFNKKNKYPKNKIKEIKESILEIGLQQFPAVYYLENEDRYVLESGEQRLTAIQELINTYKNWDGDPEEENYKLYKKNVKKYEKKITCKINFPDEEMNNEKNEAKSEIRLIATNRERRESDPVTTAEEVKRLKELYEIIGDDNKAKAINKGKAIAKDLKITERQVYKYMAVEKLIPEAKKLFEEQVINVNQAETLSKLDKEGQQAIVEVFKTDPDMNNKQIAELLRKQTSLQKELKKKTEQLTDIQASSEADKMVIDSLKADIQELKSKKEEIKKYDTTQKDFIILESRIKDLASEYEKLVQDVRVFIEKNNGSNEASKIDEMLKTMI